MILGCFVTGGVLGVLGASVMENYLLHPSLWMFLGVGLIEEAVKPAAVVFVVRRHPQLRGYRAGLVLGGSVGFGFAGPVIGTYLGVAVEFIPPRGTVSVL